MEGKIELAAFGLSSAGWLCAILTRCLPMWRVTGTAGNVTGSLAVYWDGVWMDWEHHSIGTLQCTFYQSLLTLSGNFRSWQTLIVSSIAVGVFPVVAYTVGRLKFPDRILVRTVSGVVFVLSGVLLLIAVSWTTHDTTRTLESLPSVSRGWGEALYAGWIGTALLGIGGGVLSTRCSTARQQPAPAPGPQDPFLTIHSTALRPEPANYPRQNAPWAV